MTYLYMRKRLAVFFVTGALAFTVCSVVAEETQSGVVDQQALTILDRAASFLAKQKQFSTTVEIWQDFVLEKDIKIQFAKTVELNLRRPDHFRATVTTTQPERTFFYNGKTVTLVDQSTGFFGTTAAPATIDKTLTKMEQTYGLTFPLDDLLRSNPYDVSADKAKSGQYFGIEMIMGKRCHHLAFQHEQLDWQAWVEEGPVPVLRKLIMTRKLEPGSPQYMALFSSWDFTTELPDYLFDFDEIPGLRRIDIIESVPEKNAPSSQQKTQG